MANNTVRKTLTYNNTVIIKTIRFALILLFLNPIILSGIRSANADEYHYTNLLIGDRASGMGGAYTAISDDATGLYYNPAGIVYSSGRNLSASVNAYYNLTKKYKGVIGGKGWERNSSALLPNFFGIVQPLGKIKFGFSYAVPDSSQEDQDQTFIDPPISGGTGTDISPVTKYVMNFNNQDTVYNFGPSIAAEITKSLSAGMTIYAYQKNRQIILNQLIVLKDTRYQWQNYYYESNETGVRPLIGLIWSPVDKLSFGLAASKVMLLDADANVQQNSLDFAKGGQPALLGRDVVSSTEKRKYPVQVNAGVAYFATNDLLLSADATYFTEVKDPVFGDKEAVLNAALGAEFYISRNWALRAGGFTNMTNTPEIKAGVVSWADEHVNINGGSLSISHFTRNTSVTLGGSMSYGKGEAQITADPTKVQDAEIFGWTVSLSSTYSY